VAQYPHRSINADLLHQPWSAQWIAHPTASGTAFGVFHFRRTFDLATRPDPFVVHVSADNRYRLFVNGTSVSFGPARSDLATWAFESINLAPYLRPGRNVLAAVVWNAGDRRPMAQHTFRTAFIVQGDTEREAIVNTTTSDDAEADGGWRVTQNEAYTPLPIHRADVGNAYIVVGPGEVVDAAAYPWGWEQPDFDDSAWLAAAPVRSARQEWGTNYGEFSGWRLTPRTIPLPEETPQRLRRVARSQGVDVPDGFVDGEATLVVPPHTQATVLLDQSFLTTAYPEIVVSGGAGAEVIATYAEALIDADGQKGNRNEIEGKVIRGFKDRFLPDGGEGRRFRPLWWRTYRYLQLDITTDDDALTLDDVRGVFTAYPFSAKARFTASDTTLHTIWRTGWRTARLCAGETYFDCPYYEQLQYVGDTRIQALISLYVAGDDRLMRQALTAFDASRIPEGLTQSRYPSHVTQLIPPYSLFWVAMVHDYWMHRDDPAFVASFLTSIRGVLGWYEQHRDPDGLFEPMPWWNFVDWSFPRGVPPGGDEGRSAIIALQYIYALGYAAELSDAFGRAAEAATYRARATALKENLKRLCWNESRRLFADTPDQTTFSQHTNVMAVLVDLVPPDEQAPLLNRMLADDDLTPVSYYYRFYLDRALQKAGLGDTYLQRLDPWRTMLDLGLTTFAEAPEPTRSDAHAWSASPNYHFLAIVCGITPASPGFKTVRIAPALGPLSHVTCRLPHRDGFIDVQLRRTETGLTGSITLPDDLTGTFHLNGRTISLHSGEQTVQ
jgi:hypothetical protein